MTVPLKPSAPQALLYNIQVSRAKSPPNRPETHWLGLLCIRLAANSATTYAVSIETGARLSDSARATVELDRLQ